MARGLVRKRGNRWYAIYPITDPATGRRRQKEEVAGDTRRAAERLLRDRLHAVDENRYIEPSKQTFAAYLDNEWLPSVRSTLKASTFESYSRNLRLHVIPRLGGTPLQQINAPALNRLYGELLASGRSSAAQRRHGNPGLSPRTVAYVHSILHRAFKDAVKWGSLERNPADAADPPKAESADDADVMRTWTAEQLGRFLDACAERDDRAASRYLPAWLVASTTGLRRGELLGLTWDAVDLDKATARIERTVNCIEHRIVFGTPKTKKGRRTIELGAETVAVLRRWRVVRSDEGGWPAGDEWVFCHPDGRPYHPERFSREFDRMQARLDLPRIRLHDLRHTYATLGLEAGEHPRVMADRLGHSRTSVTLDIYSHVTPSMDRELAERQERRIFRKDGT